MNIDLSKLNTKNITTDFILKHFDIDKEERKIKKIDYEEIHRIDDVLEQPQSLKDIDKWIKNFTKTIDKQYDPEKIFIEIVSTGYGCGCCDYPTIFLKIYAYHTERPETDKEVIERLKRKLKRKIKKNEQKK